MTDPEMTVQCAVSAAPVPAPDPIAAAEREVIASAIKWKLSNNQFDDVLNAYDVGAKVDELLRLRAAQVSKP
jgi:hypothetical protein